MDAFELETKPAERPIWLESLAGVDWMLLHLAPVYYGWGVPHGDGAAVVVVPGFLGADFYLGELYFWLRRIGYRPYLSGIGWNANCINTLTKRLNRTVNQAYAETGRPVHLIGHSLGGILSRAVATSEPDKIASLITLGTPFRGLRSHPWVLNMAEQIRRRLAQTPDPERRPDCYTGFCDCPAATNMRRMLPADFPQTALYTRLDGIVDWTACRYDDDERDIEVVGTHIGLAFNHQVYRHIAHRLQLKK